MRKNISLFEVKKSVQTIKINNADGLVAAVSLMTNFSFLSTFNHANLRYSAVKPVRKVENFPSSVLSCKDVLISS